MEEQTNKIQPLKFIRPDLFQVGAVFGAIAAIVCFLYIILLYTLDVNSFGRWKNVYFPIYGLFFAGGMTYFRLKRNNGRLLAPQGILIGVTLNIVASTLYGILLQLILSTKGIGATMLQRHSADLKRLLIEGREMIVESIGEAEYLKQIEGVEQLTPDVLAVDQAFGMLFLGFFLTFLFMLIIKKK
ncbi:DUF4199 family protein [Flammeovirga sp. SubArs3]|uniref:DUF4199 family protein n=1 Tax=Flammeovirga sp. SubArs3 TaxID=2995316 RepID=UPI00248C04AB|nr:DUF4199 family protein [Flammeovirga sp. SubArs3]